MLIFSKFLKTKKTLLLLGIIFVCFLVASGLLLRQFLLKYQKYHLGAKEVVGEIIFQRKPLVQVAAEKNFSWQPTEITSHLVKGEQTQKIFMVLGELIEKEDHLWTIRPADSQELEVALGSQTKFYQRQPVLTEDQFGWGEKSLEIPRESFQIKEVVMVEWINGVWENAPKRRVIALTVSKRE